MSERLNGEQVAALTGTFTTRDVVRNKWVMRDAAGSDVGASEVRALALEVQASRALLATLRRWMAEYPNDKYTGAWWLAELDRITSADFQPKDGAR